MHTTTGTTLLELLLSLLLSTILIAGLVTLVLSAQHYYNLQSDLVNLTENLRFTEQLFSRLFHASSDGYFQSSLNNNELHVEYKDSSSQILIEDMKDPLILYGLFSWKKGDNIIISDGISTEKFIIQEASSNKIIANHPLNKLYKKNAELNLLRTESYFIRKMALYRNPPTMELVEGVTDMQIEYNTLQNGQLITTHDFSKAVAVEITLYHHSQKQIIYVALG